MYTIESVVAGMWASVMAMAVSDLQRKILKRMDKNGNH